MESLNRDLPHDVLLKETKSPTTVTSVYFTNVKAVHLPVRESAITVRTVRTICFRLLLLFSHGFLNHGSMTVHIPSGRRVDLDRQIDHQHSRDALEKLPEHQQLQKYSNQQPRHSYSRRDPRSCHGILFFGIKSCFLRLLTGGTAAKFDSRITDIQT